MILTLKDLRDQCLRYVDEDGDTGTTKTLFNNLLNQANHNRAMEFPSMFLVWDIPSLLLTEVGRQTYALHEEFGRPLYFYNRTAKSYLKEIPERQLGPEGYRWNDAEGTAQHFVLWGRTQVKRQPTSASVLTIISSDAADSGGGAGLQLMVRGETADGSVKAEIINPNGLTSVNSTNSYVKIMQVTKAGPWTGTMTMTSNSGNVTNLVLDYCDLGKNYQQLFLIENPTAVETIEYRFYRNPIKMTNDYDQPDISYPYSQILVWDALIMFAGYNTEVSQAAIMSWKEMQSRMEIAMANAFMEGQSLEARVRHVRPMDHTDWSERVRWD